MNFKDNLIVQLSLQKEYLFFDQVEECKRLQLEYEKQGRNLSLEEIFLERGLLTKQKLEEIYKQLSEEVSSRTEVVMMSKENTMLASQDALSVAASPDAKDASEHTQTVSSQFLKKLQNIGRYKIVKQLGKGGMGVVYKAEDELLKRAVAIKVLLQYDAATTIQTKRFLIEAQATASLSHPNIVAVYDIGQLEQENFYLVMEYVDGSSLAEIIKERGPLSFSESIEITRQVAQALHAAHSLKIVHRDIKPANILLHKNGLAKVTDFGLAKMVSASSLGGISYSGQILGTPFYIAPEQIESSQIDGRADIYSLGITFYQMLTQRLPFEGDDIYSLLLARFKKPATPITKYNPGVPSAMARIVHQMIEQKPEARISSAIEVVDKLTKLAQGEHTSIYLKENNRSETKASSFVHFVYFFIFISLLLSSFWPVLYTMKKWELWNFEIQESEGWEKIQTAREMLSSFLWKYQKTLAKKDAPVVKPDEEKKDPPVVKPDEEKKDPNTKAEENQAIIQGSLVLLKVEGLYPPQTLLKSYTATLNNSPWKDTILKEGTYDLKIEHPGYFPIQKQIIIPKGPGVFTHKEILYPKPRSVFFAIEYDAPPFEKVDLEIMVTQEEKPIPFSNGALLTPGKYHFKIIPSGYFEETLEQEIPPGEEVYTVPLKCKAKEIEYTLYLKYESPIASGTKPPEFFALEKNQERLLLYRKEKDAYIFSLPMHTQKIKIAQEGFESESIIFSLDTEGRKKICTLVPSYRVLSPFIVDTNSNKKVQPVEIRYLKKRFASGEEIKVRPGRISLEIYFKEYKSIEKFFFIPVGKAPFVIQHDLEALESFRFSLQSPFFSESFLFFIDKKRIPSYHADYRKEASIANCVVYLPFSGKNFTVIHEFLSAEIELSQKSQPILEWSEIRKDYLEVYLRLLQKEKGNSFVWDFMHRLVSDAKIQNILKKDKDLGLSLQKIAQEDTFGQDSFYQKKILDILKSLYLSTGLSQEIWSKVKDKYQEITVAKVQESKEFVLEGINPQGYLEYKHKKSELLFVLLPGGTFAMGSPKEQFIRTELESPQHQVTLDSFMIAKFEVSQKASNKVLHLNYWFPGENLPAHNLSWDQANVFCQKYDLDFPTEAEWEYACRAGSSSLFYWGNDYDNEYLWCEQNSRRRLQNIGLKLPNAFGLYDMSGNVAEWCKDVWGRYTSQDKVNPSGPAPKPFQNSRAVRGGSYQMDCHLCRSAYRHFFRENYQGDIGIRPVWRLK